MAQSVGDWLQAGWRGDQSTTEAGISFLCHQIQTSFGALAA